MDVQTTSGAAIIPRSSPTRPACSTSATGTACTGNRAATPPANRWCSSTAAPARESAKATAASSIPTNTTSSCSTSAGAANRPRTRASRITRPGTWSPTSRSCGKMVGARNGRRSAALGLDAGVRLCADPPGPGRPSWCFAASSCSSNMSSTGCTRRAARRSSTPTNGTSSSRSFPRRSAADLIAAFANG